MHIIEKIASVISPVVGGLLATLFDPVVVMIVAASSVCFVRPTITAYCRADQDAPKD